MIKLTVSKFLFQLGDNEYAWQKDFDDQGWQSVTVPHDWSVAQDFSQRASSGTGYLPGGIGWYRGHVSLGELTLAEGQRLELRFDGIYKEANIWVNGYYFGSRPSGYSSSTFDLTEVIELNTDEELVIAVRVDHTDIADSRWYNGSGITRPVSLVVLDPVHVERYGISFTTKELSFEKTQVAAKVKLTNTLPVAVTGKVKLSLQSLCGSSHYQLGTQEVTLSAEDSQILDWREELISPSLWSPESPNLYQVHVETTFAGYTSDYQEKIGIRTFSFDPETGFYLNNQVQYKLKGVCLHEDAGVLGTAVPTAVWARRLIALKKMGCNAIRMAHNPHAQNLYDLCDALGFFVIDEAFDEWENPKNKWWQGHNVYPPKFEGYAKDFPVWHEADLVDMVQRNKNRPSIIAWSIGNEIDYPNDPYANPKFKEMTGNNDHEKPEQERMYSPGRPDIRRLSTIAKELARIVRQVDESRPVTLAAAFPELSAETGLLDNIDLIGYNYKEHLYEMTSEQFPTIPLLGSENSNGYQQWLSVKENERISGQFLWTGIDYLGEAHGWPIHGSGAGLLTLAGFEKAGYARRQSFWSDELVVSLATLPYTESDHQSEWANVFRKWNYEMGEQVEIRCYSNAETLVLQNSETLIPLIFNQEHGYYSAVVSFESGILQVTARRGEEEVSDQLVPLGESTTLCAQVWQDAEAEALLSKQQVPLEPIYQIELTFKDLNNNPTTTERMISFTGENCQLLGLENGDLADVTSYQEKSRRSYQGKLIAYVTCEGQGVASFMTAGLSPVTVELGKNN